jgi:hypothetical protein
MMRNRKIAALVLIVSLLAAWAWRERVVLCRVGADVVWCAGSAVAVWAGCALKSMNENAGGYGVLIGLAGLFLSWWTKNRMVRLAEKAAAEGRLTVRGGGDDGE